jgi:6-phosphogluconate dehydrogenase (decarboxylating)
MIDVDSFNNKNQKAGQVSSENIGEYFNRLSNHDWYYDYSDDHSVWKRGSANRDRLLNTAAEHPNYKKMYNEFVNWMRSNRERPVVTEFYDEV